ncbi:MAG: glycosyltransferase [Acidobacteria bacterium]|nr:glycosyltransferase [Acidobacteriota bacterium]
MKYGDSPLLSRCNVLFVAGSLSSGGAERQLFYCLRTLRQEGAEVRVASLSRGGVWEARLKALGIEVRSFEASPSRLGRIMKLAKMVRTEPADVIQSQHFFANGYAALIGRAFGGIAIGSIRSDGQRDMNGCGRWGGWFNLHTPRFIVANSRPAIDFAAMQGIRRERLFLFPNVVDTETFVPTSPRTDSTFRLILVGRIIREKRVDRFLRVVSKLQRTIKPKVHALIVGSDGNDRSLREQLRRLASDLGLPVSTVEFQPEVENPAPFYQRSDVCVLTSDVEGTPNVLLEAMASGLPVVATRVGGVADIVVDGKTGFLVDCRDEEAMVQALRRFVEDPCFRTKMGGHARSHVETQFSIKQLPGRLTELYDRAFAD